MTAEEAIATTTAAATATAPTALDDFVQGWLSTEKLENVDTETITIVQDSHKLAPPTNGRTYSFSSSTSPRSSFSSISNKKQSRWSCPDINECQKLTTQYALLQTIRGNCHQNQFLQSSSSHTSLSPPKQPRRSITPEKCLKDLPASQDGKKNVSLSSMSNESSLSARTRTVQQVTTESLRIALGLLSPK